MYKRQGLYFGARETVEQDGQMVAKDTLVYSEAEIRRIAVKGFDIARKRRKKVTVSYTHLDVYKRQPQRHSVCQYIQQFRT